MRNVQSREIAAPAAAVGALLDRLAGPDDVLWPTPAWPPIRFDRGLAVGAVGGHGPIRYSVAEYEPGRRLRCRFAQRAGLRGYHELRVEPCGPATCRVVHELAGTLRGSMIVGWPVAVRWLHEALIQDLLDNAERVATGRLSRPARWSAWVRLLRGGLASRARATPGTSPRGAVGRVRPGPSRPPSQ
jgi:hypothetical protein